MSFKKEAFDKAGLFSTSFGLRNSKKTSWADPPSEDIDISLRIKAETGKRIVYSPYVKVSHRVHSHRIKQKFIMQRSYSVGYQRRMLKRLYPDAGKNSNVLNQECQLLKRIITKLFPHVFKTFFTHPVTAWRQLKVTVTVLSFVALGYLFYFLTHVRNSNQVIISARGDA